jgi:pantothenate kinase
MPRKGAPETFDAGGFTHLLKRLRSAGEVAIPVFDRDADLARAGADVVGAGDRILIVEGNYLLLDRAPWSTLRPLFDLTIFLATPEAELERRLIQRWRDQGLSPEAARVRAEGNDLPNARLVARHSAPADITLR